MTTLSYVILGLFGFVLGRIILQHFKKKKNDEEG